MNSKDLLYHDVCRLFAEGLSLTDIPDAVTKRRETTLISHDVYRLLRDAGLRRHLSYTPRVYDGASAFLQKTLSDKHDAPTLHDVQVVFPSIDAVATACADHVYNSILQRIYNGTNEPTVCFSGGMTSALIIDKLYSRLLHPEPRLQDILHQRRENRAARVRAGASDPDPFSPENLTLHFRSVVPLFDQKTLDHSPNGALLIFRRHEFVKAHGDVLSVYCYGTPAPPLIAVEHAEVERTLKQDLITKATQADILVTSASSINFEMGMLQRFYMQTDEFKAVRSWLKKHGTIGNMMVFPLTKEGALGDDILAEAVIDGRTDFPIYPNTLIRPQDLPTMVAGGCEVVLAIPTCHVNKTEYRHIRQIIELAARNKMISQLVCTLKTAHAFGFKEELEFGDFLTQGVARYFSEGQAPANIPSFLGKGDIPQAGRRKPASEREETDGDEIGRQTIYKVLDRPAFHQEIVYHPSTFSCLSDRLEQRYSTLRGIHVAKTGIGSVATLTADHIYRMIMDRLTSELQSVEESIGPVSKKTQSPEPVEPAIAIPISIGFSGGQLVNAVIDCLYNHLVHPDEIMMDVQRRLRHCNRTFTLNFHSLVPMIEANHLTLSPTGTLASFKDRDLRRQKQRLVVNAYGVNTSILPVKGRHQDDFGGNTKQEEEVHNLDIVVTSACSMRRDGNLLKFFYADGLRKQADDWLKSKQAFGSMLLYPFTPAGYMPEEVLRESENSDTPLYPNTLLKPWDLHNLVKKQAKVLLMLSGDASNSADHPQMKEILREEAALFRLANAQQIVTHAFVGATIARELLTDV